MPCPVFNSMPMLLFHEFLQMGSKLFRSFILYYSITAFFFIFIAIPTCFCDDKQQYEDCRSRLYECGELKGIGYPFWGGGRPQFCGQQGLELKCQDDDYSLIHTDSLEFRVLNINESAYTMTIARTDFWDQTCPKEFHSTTLNYTLFDYAGTNRNLTLFYGCSDEILSRLPSNWTISNNFTCSVEGTDNTTAFYADEAFLGLDQYLPILGTCEINITLPVLVAALNYLKENRTGEEVSNGDRLEKALIMGFDVDYSRVRGFCVPCRESGGICGSSSTSPFSCLCRDKSYPYSCQKSESGSPMRKVRKVLIAIAIAGGGVLLSCFLIMCCCCRRNFSKYKLASIMITGSDDDKNIEAFVKNYGSLAPKRYSYLDVKKMTDSFKDKLGQGGFGSVYRGKLPDGRLVAVKLLKISKEKGEEFINEVASISRTSHVNIVSLLGFCYESGKRALIYEFMCNGSLEKFIHDEDPPRSCRHLAWENLYQIAIGVARGLEYLHCRCNTRILHFDVKPHNILLDEDFCPKISDFGLAKLCHRKDGVISMWDARGTMGYVAPEMFNRNFGEVSSKSDVYSYGMMILEMVGGRKNLNAAASHTSKIYFPHWVYKRLELAEGHLGLQGIVSQEENETARKMILVGLWCIQTDPSHRPSMSKVIDMLEGGIEALQIPPKPFLSSPPRSPADSSTAAPMDNILLE